MHGGMRCAVALALTLTWMTTAVAACAAVTPAMRCHGIDMPCCPPSGANHARCAAAQCTEQIPQKAEAAPQAPVLQPSSTMRSPATLQGAAGIRELVSGLRFQTQVFRLKDDFRI